VPLPDAPAREDILRVLLRGERVEGGVAQELRGLAAQTEGYSGSDLREVVKAAALLPVQEALGAGGAGGGGGGGGGEGAAVRALTAVDLMLALDRVRPAVEKPMEYLKKSQGGR
jgi:SpoVK/Ycf46/Vps4 family AAA+-type ATPase